MRSLLQPIEMVDLAAITLAPIRFRPDLGSIRLLHALLVDALEIALRTRRGIARHTATEAEAWEWLLGETDGRITMETCCEALGLDPNAVRRALLALRR